MGIFKRLHTTKTKERLVALLVINKRAMRINKLSYVFAILLLAVILIVSCGGGSGTTTPATTIETSIPSDYTTYTSEGLFSISYPSDWEHSLSMTELFDRFIKEELITIIESDLPIVDGNQVSDFPNIFSAVGPTGRVGITVVSPPAVIWTLDSVVEVIMLPAIDDPAFDYNEFSRVKTTVGGREVVIIDYQFSVPMETFGDTIVGVENIHNLWMFTLVGKTAWIIGCGTTPGMFSDYEDDCNAIIRNFRMLN